MNLLSRILASTALCATAAISQAQAADYDPPIMIEEAPEYVPVEVGSGWYLRGDIGYSFDNAFVNESYDGPYVYDPDYDESHTAIFGSIGMGYHFTDYFRGDLNFGFLSKGDQNLGYSQDWYSSYTTVTTENQAWTAIANAYVDLGTYVGITPYLGAGIGLAYSERSQSYDRNFYDSDIWDVSESEDKHQVSFAYTLNAGASYKMTDNLSVDLGYQFLGAPDLEYSEIDNGEPVVRSGINIHQIRAGLRYDLW